MGIISAVFHISVQLDLPAVFALLTLPFVQNFTIVSMDGFFLVILLGAVTGKLKSCWPLKNAKEICVLYTRSLEMAERFPSHQTLVNSEMEIQMCVTAKRILISVLICFFYVLWLLMSPIDIFAFTFSGTIVDGLNRPYENAKIDLFRYKKDERIIERTITTDKNGKFKIELGEADKDLKYGFTRKAGIYSELGEVYDADGGITNIVLKTKRSVSVDEIKDLLNLPGTTRNSKFLDVLASDFEIDPKDEVFRELFKINKQLEPAVLSATGNQFAKQEAIIMSLFFAYSNISDLAIQEINRDKDIGFPVRNYLASSLVAPKTEAEWSYLENCIKSQCVSGAVLALMASNSKRSQNILMSTPLRTEFGASLDVDVCNRKLLPKDPSGEIFERCLQEKAFNRTIKPAQDFKRQHPDGLKSSTDIQFSIIDSTALLIKYGQNETTEQFKIHSVIFDQEKNKAIVNVGIAHGPLNARSYILTFQQVEGFWTLRGVWLTRVS